MKARQVVGSSSFFDGASQVAAPEKEPKKLFPICACRSRGTNVATRQNPGEKSFFASFFSKKEDSCLLASSGAT
jgi:hypothetical protein